VDGQGHNFGGTCNVAFHIDIDGAALLQDEGRVELEVPRSPAEPRLNLTAEVRQLGAVMVSDVRAPHGVELAQFQETSEVAPVVRRRIKPQGVQSGGGEQVVVRARAGYAYLPVGRSGITPERRLGNVYAQVLPAFSEVGHTHKLEVRVVRDVLLHLVGDVLNMRTRPEGVYVPAVGSYGPLGGNCARHDGHNAFWVWLLSGICQVIHVSS